MLNSINDTHANVQLQQTDLVALGQLILCLCCQSLMAMQPENFAKSIQHVSRNFSPDMLKIIQYVVLYSIYCRVPFSRATNFVNGLKKEVHARKQFSWIYIGDACIVRPLFSCMGIIAFSISTLHDNNVWPIVRLVLAITLYNACLLVSDPNWDMTNSRKIWFGVVSNSGMHVVRSFYVLTTYQYFRSGDT